jgi:hypothetical protein
MACVRDERVEHRDRLWATRVPKRLYQNPGGALSRLAVLRGFVVTTNVTEDLSTGDAGLTKLGHLDQSCRKARTGSDPTARRADAARAHVGPGRARRWPPSTRLAARGEIAMGNKAN